MDWQTVCFHELAHVPKAEGVYVIHVGGAAAYVGETHNLQKRFRLHRNTLLTDVRRDLVRLHFLLLGSRRWVLERALIRALRPVWNVRKQANRNHQL